jgi:AcrR family transcriptional regulator
MSTDTRDTEALAPREPSAASRARGAAWRPTSATKALMAETGGDAFTLQDVSDRGQASIGSIYLQFESKDRLLHAVIAEELTAVIAKERAMLDATLAESAARGEFLLRYIARDSDFLKFHAPLLRTIMPRAAVDSAVSEPGKETARRSSAMAPILGYA